MNGCVYYLGHSCFAVATGRLLLVFDPDDGTPVKGGLETGAIDFSLHADKTVIILSSHNHADHYGRALHKAGQKYGNVFHALGGFKSESQKNTITINAGQSAEIGGVAIRAGGSTDAGVCFLAEANGLVVFHAGDNADWGDGDPANASYYREIDHIAGICGERSLRPDAAFIPCCTFQGKRPPDMTKGAIYAVNKLNPEIVFPMHANGRENLYEEFEADLRKSEGGSERAVVCMERPGQKYEILTSRGGQ